MVVALLLQGAAELTDAQDGWPLVSRQPYVQMVTHDSAVIVWRTERPIFPVVFFGESLDALNRIVASNQIIQRVAESVDAPPDIPRLHSAPPGTHQYEASVKGLQNDTVYFYAIYDFLDPVIGGDDRHSFRTAPDIGNDDRPARFWVLGDSGDGSVGQYESYRGFQNYLHNEDAPNRKPVDAMIHVGDMAYTGGGDAEFSANFFGVYKDLLRNTCCWPSMGNHEGSNSRGSTGIGPYFDSYVMPTRGEAGGVASGTESYYAFDFGQIHFVCLNSHDLDRTPSSAMAQWLIADLEATTARWLIAFWHHPPYTKGTHDSDREIQLIEMREYIMPILENAGVDLILTGHSHTYERSMLIDGAYSTPTTVRDVVLDDGDGDPAGHGPYRKSPALNPNEGSVSVVAGHGRFAFQFYGESPVMRRTIPVIGSFLLDVDGDTLTGRMLDGEGTARDTFQIVKDSAVQPQRLAHPWRPVGPTILVTSRSSAHRTLEMFPVPPSPDAIVRYEINGDEVDVFSPIYDSPIPLAATDRLVQAKTFWNNGTRVSPATSFIIPASTIGSSSTQVLTIPLSHGEDDATESADGRVALDSEVLRLGDDEQSTIGLRFEDIGLPHGAIIYRASLQFHSTVFTSAQTELDVRIEETGNAVAFSELPFGISSRNFSEEQSFKWSPAPWFYGRQTSSQRSPDFGQTLQRQIAQPNWEAGNSLAFAISGTGLREAWAFDYSPRAAARLRIEFDTRPPLEIALSQPFTVQPIQYRYLDGTFSDGIRIETQSLELPHSDIQLDYQIETSQHLDEQSWKPLPDSELIRYQYIRVHPWLGTTIELPTELLSNSTDYFFRLKITKSPVIEEIPHNN